MAIVSTDDLKNIINFETEQLQNELNNYLVAQDNSFAGATSLNGGDPLIEFIKNKTTLYICHLGKASEVLEYKLERPDAPTDFSVDAEKTTATSITLNAIDGAEYRMDSKDWQDEATFDGLDPTQNIPSTPVSRLRKAALLLCRP